MAMELAGSEKRRGRLGRYVYVACQLAHVFISLSFLAAAVTEFVAESPYFDILGHASTVPAEDLYKNVSGQSLQSSFRRVMDLPVLTLFLFYVVVVIWFRGRGIWAWSTTLSMLLLITTFLTVNLWAGQLLDWRFFSDRVLSILLNVLAISYCYSINLVAVFNARNWFPFKIHAQRMPLKSLPPRVLLVCWNLIVLMLILTLCLLVWFSRLYTSWVCVRSVDEVLLLCQFTGLVQCWPCGDAESCAGVEECVTGDTDPYHCLSPLHAASGGVESAFCVFNYNIGPFTFITVFAYVGGLYFFLRTTVNAVIKCLRVLVYLTLQGARRLLLQPPSPCLPATRRQADYSTSSSEEEEHQLHLTDDQLSLHTPPSNTRLLNYR